MSVASRNPFELLMDDAEDSSAVSTPTPKAAAPKAAAPAPAAAATSAPAPAANKARSNYPTRGGPRNVLKDAGGGRPAQDPESGYSGERINSTRGSDRPRGRGRGIRGGTGAGAVSHGGFDRKSAGHTDSHKKETQGWGQDTGAAELDDEVLGAADANKDLASVTPGAATPADGTATPAETEETKTEEKKTDAPAAPAKVEEEVDNSISYEEYIKNKAAAVVEGVTALAKRVVGDWEGGGTAVKKGGDDSDFYAAKEKAQKVKEAKAKKEKVFIEIEPKFAPVGGSERGRGGGRGGRGGRGEGRGGFGGEGRGSGDAARGGERPRGRGRGAPRGRGANGAASSGPRSAGPSVDLADNKAFPSLA